MSASTWARTASGTSPALYGFSDTQITTSPTYLPTLPPSGEAAFGGAGVFVVPGYAPSVRDYCTTFGAASRCTTGAGGVPNSVLAFPVLFRAALLGGNPQQRNDDNYRGSAIGDRNSDLIRLTSEVRTGITDTIDLTTSISYSYYERLIGGTDSFGDRFQNALAGFGGFNCPYQNAASRVGLTATQLAGLAGTNGCQFFNPFSTAVQANARQWADQPQLRRRAHPRGVQPDAGGGADQLHRPLRLFLRQYRQHHRAGAVRRRRSCSRAPSAG